ncbi:MAG TPA: ATP-binding protein, partial [Bacteroidia bacterium]|nr:ATP-binding protein [Bacteroidia bacterium]
TSAVSGVGEPNKKLLLWKSGLENIDQAAASLQRWKLSTDPAELRRIDSFRQNIYEKIYQLQQINFQNPEARVLTDSLKGLTGLWFENLGNLIIVHDTAPTNDIVVDNIMEEMAMREAERRRTLRFYNHDTVKMTANPAIPADTEARKTETQTVQPKEKEEDNFWTRVVSRLKKKTAGEKTAGSQDPNQPVVSPEIASTPSPKKYVSEPADTLYKEPVIETERIRRAIARGSEKKMSITEAKLREEMHLLRTDNALMTRIRLNSDVYERIVNTEMASLIQSATLTTSAGTKSVMWWASGISLFFVVIFASIIERDIVREGKVRVQLQEARKNAERLAKAKEEFLANMSHEIRTPLNIISGFGAQLLKSRLNAMQRMQAESVARSSDHLMALVSDILDYSKIESGKLTLESIGFHASGFDTDLRAAFEQNALKKRLKFNVKVSPDLPAVLVGDPVRIRQILFNLASNALKFTERGQIDIRIEPVVGRPRGTIRITVTDTGIGIPPEHLVSIFEAFTQADTSISRRYGGTGLGLTITRFLVEKMDGEIEVDSIPGEGTTFTVTLPLKAGSKKDLPEGIVESDGNILKEKNVLVCDDEPFNRILATHVLQSYGAIVLEAADGHGAISVLGREPVDLVLMDLQMPGMSGKEATAAIRASNQPYADVKIIAVTGRAFAGEKEKCLEVGMNGYLAKPYKEAQLLKVISEVLSAQTRGVGKASI